MLAAAGVWPAVPLTGYIVFMRAYRTGTFSSLTAFCVMTVTGLVVWSVPLLGSAVAGIYRPAYLGLIGWGVTLIIAVVVWRARQALASTATPAPGRTRRENRTLHPREAERRRGATAPSESKTQRAWDWMLAVGLVVAAALYLGFPSESIYGGRDEGVYANHAVYLAHHGRLDVPYPWPQDLSELFADRWQGFPGFYPTQPTMTVQFGHLFPVWLGQAFATLAQHGLFRLNAVLAVLSLGVFYGVCRLVLPASSAVVATLFLAFNPSQLWMARVTLSEILTQLLTWSGVLLLLQALRDDRKLPARWAGVLFGFAGLAHFDGMLLFPVLFLAHLVVKIVEEPAGKSAAIWRALYLTALPTFAVALGYYVMFSRPYFVSRPYLYQLAGAGVVSSLGLLLLTRGLTRHLHAWLTHRIFLTLVGIGLLVLAAYAYWIRPIPSGPPQLVLQRPGFYQDLTKGNYQAESLVDLAQYLSPVVVWLAIGGWFAGVWKAVREARETYVMPALIIVLAFSVVYL